MSTVLTGDFGLASSTACFFGDFGFSGATSIVFVLCEPNFEPDLDDPLDAVFDDDFEDFELFFASFGADLTGCSGSN